MPLLVGCIWSIGCSLGLAQSLAYLFLYPAGARARMTMTTVGWLRTLSDPYLEPLGEFVRTPNGGLTFKWTLLEYTPYPVKAWLACCVVMPLMLLILPRSRAMVKVRPIHVWRAAVYGTALLLAWPLEMFFDGITGLFPAIYRWNYALSTFRGGRPALFMQAGWTLLGVGWFALWWWIVLVRVFALPNGKWVWGLLMVACVLAATAVAALTMDFAILIFG